ncbi:MAG: hydroxyacid dehydrogenase [Gloeobacteraceae cyanobacterium ES-bin-144]|nr:hydroxyacid dehydrogenase [Verrucomicrobiales bacterium]
MKILFFELEGWEQPYLEKLLPAGQSVDYYTHKVTAADAQKLASCDILSTFIFSQVNAEILRLAPSLKLVATRSTGYDHIDCAAAKKNGIHVSNVPEYGSNTVAEHTFALLLALSRRVIPAYTRTRAGTFDTSGLRGFDLRGKLLGVVGTGNIGLHVIRIATSFGMRVIAYDPFPRKSLADILNFEYVPLEALIVKSDIITFHCPATKENHHMVRADSIARMKRGVVLINTARGTLMNTHDLLAALESGHIAAVGLDVLEGEQIINEDVQLLKDANRDQLLAAIETHKLLARENVIITPHNAFNSEEAVQRILNTTAENIQSFVATGRPANPLA